MSFHLEPEVLELQEERRDLLATGQEGTVLQLAEDRVQRMKQLDDGHGNSVDDDAEVVRTALLEQDESSGAKDKIIIT